MPNPATDPVAPTTTLYLPPLDKTVTVNAADEPYLRERYDAVTPAEWERQQAAAARAAATATTSEAKPKGKPFQTKAEKDAQQAGASAEGTPSTAPNTPTA
jgi:hypothetical protein